MGGHADGWNGRHDQVLGEADPARAGAPLTPTDLDRMWGRVAERTTATGSTPRRRPRRTLAAGVAAIALLGAGGTAAASTILSSHTGRSAPDREALVLGGPGEYLDPEGDDFMTIVTEQTRSIPFPSARSRQISLDIQSQEEGPGVVSTGAIAGFVADDAICSWADDWARATYAGDAEAVATATSVLDSSSDWPSVSVLQDLDEARFGWLPGVQRAAHGASTADLGAALAEKVFCRLELVPHLPEALPADLPRCASSLYEPCPGSDRTYRAER